ncbi:MAG: hypothetical protein HY530_04375 [Chloroflexi bacterium]|nr:hypothetical protein [Chloroflexota bacterium]
MKKKRLTALSGSICLILILTAMLLMPACAKAPAPTSTPIPTVTVPAPTVTALGPTVTVTATPTPTPVSAADFYRTHTVTIVANSTAGGGTDYGARLLAAYWNGVTGGTMIVKNEPGGIGLVAINQVYSAKPDGLTIGTGELGSHVVGYALFGNPGIQYDPKKLTYIGHFAAQPTVLSVGINQPYQSMDDLKQAKGLIFGISGTEGIIASGTAMVLEFFGLDGKMVAGYRGADIGLAAAKGEITGYVYSASIVKKDIEKGFVKPPILSTSLEKTLWFPDTPAIPELIKLSPEQEALLKLHVALSTAKGFFAPPGIPEDRVKFLQDAFIKIAGIDGFVTQAKLQFPVWVPVDPGPKVAEMVNAVMNSPKEVVAKYSEVIKKYLK